MAFASIVQLVNARPANSAASVTTTAVTTTNGNSFVVAVGCSVASRIGSTAVTDSKGNTYTRAIASSATTGPGVSIFYTQAGTGGASHTFTLTTTSSSFIWMTVFEVFDMKTTPLSGTNTTTATSTTHNSGTITSVDNELWVAAGITDSGTEGTPIAAASWLAAVYLAPSGVAEGSVVAVQCVPTGTTGQFTYTAAASFLREAMIAGFKMQASATGSTATSVAYLG